MNQIFKSLSTACLFFCLSMTAQNPGLIISEILANPNGTDSCKEYVELLATQNINFSMTPFSVVVNNNGTATNQGWISGGSLSYAFEINSGSVIAGSVIYVGGSCMTPTTGQLRIINVKNFNGDFGMGLANAAGVFGNGGSNADGVAVFNMPVLNLSPATVPVDVVFYGTSIGSASVNAGIDGYQLPVNDIYTGGKLNSTSFLAPDPGADILITMVGMFNTTSNTWSISRTVTTGTNTTPSVSSVSLTNTGTVSPATISFLNNDTTVIESAPSGTVYVRLTATSPSISSISVLASAKSNAGATDYTFAVTTVTFAANAPINSSAPIVININNDATIESAEYIALRFYNPQNMNIGTINQFAFYISDNDKIIPTASNALTLNLLSSFSNSTSGANSAEIVAHDPTTQRLYIANSIGGKLDIVNFINPSNPVLLYSVPITTYGNINSVAVRDGIVATAIENSNNPQDSGKVVFFDKNGVFISQVKVGMMPDMITFNQAGNKVLTANEGEPNAAYTMDPDGSVSIINISGGVAAVTQSNVANITFTAYNGQETSLRAQGIRIYGLGANTSKDFEPEYIAVSKDDTKAYVTLQENNAVVEINLTTNSITAIRALGTKDHSLLNNGADFSNLTRSVNISNFPIKGFYLPDAIASYTVGGVNYYITANEGDSRAYTGFTEEVRLASANLDPTRFPHATQWKNNYLLGRINITDKTGDTDNDGDLDTLYSYGSRSFSIWNGATGNLVYDSKDDFEQITSTNSYSNLFNVSNSNNTKKDRSDDKGPEPEGVTIGTIGSNIYAFIAIERIGGVMVYDVTTPSAPTFVTYVNNRYLPSGGPDRGSEGIIFIPQSQSPNGQYLVVAANEISSTLSTWGIPGCNAPLGSSLSVSGVTTGACSGNPPVLSVASNTALTYQWYLNGSSVSGATSNTYSPSSSGNFSVAINGGSNCVTSSLNQSISINPNPTLSVSGATMACFGSGISQTVSGAATYTWSSNNTGSVVVLTPNSTSVYSITGTSNGCNTTITRTITATLPPTLSIKGPSIVCIGSTVSQTVTGANSYLWNTGSTASVISISPSVSTMYSVTGTSNAGCIGTIAYTLPVVSNPIAQAVATRTSICFGESSNLWSSSIGTYSWSNGSTSSSVTVNPALTTTYILSVKDENLCQSSASITVQVDVCAMISEETSHEEVLVYPNPANEFLSIKSNGLNKLNRIVIYDIVGKIIYSEEGISDFVEINTSMYSKGIYTIVISSSNQPLVRKLILE